MAPSHTARPLVCLTGLLMLGPWALSRAASPGSATLSIEGKGAEIQVQLSGPAASLVGFEGAPRTAEERETLALAEENLKTGDGLVRFSTNAGCRLEQATIDADPAPKGKGPADLGASYRFHCDRPEALDSAALGLFMGFPALARVLVHYDLSGIRGEAAATPGNPVVSFVPLQ